MNAPEPSTSSWFSAVPPGELILAEEAGVVDVHLIVELRGAALDLDPAGSAIARALDVGHDVVVGHFVDGLDDAQILVRAQLHVGADEHFDGELELLAAADLLNVQLGTVDDVDLVLLSAS